MKKILICLLALFSVIQLNAQDFSILKLNSYLDLSLMMNKNYWELYHAYNAEDQKPFDNATAAKKYEDYTKDKISDEKSPYKKYEQDAVNFLNRLTLFGRSLAKFYCLDSECPINYNEIDEGQLCVVMQSPTTDDVYNTLKLTARQRAAKSIASTAIPILQEISNHFVDIKYYVIVVTYGSKNFSNDSMLTGEPLKGESVAIVTPRIVARDFASKKITEDELIEKSDIYLSDRDTNVGTKKVKIVME